MSEIGKSPYIFIVPCVALSFVLIIVLLVRFRFFQSKERASTWAVLNTRRATPSSTSVEIQTTSTVPYVPPPGYYSEVLGESSYPVYVPPYSSSTAEASLRDPRRYQGLHGLSAPPPYPAPPSYSQVTGYPEMPIVTRLDNRVNRVGPRAAKKGEPIAPVE